MDLLRPPSLLVSIEAPPRVSALGAAGDLLVLGFDDGRVIALHAALARSIVDFSTQAAVSSVDCDAAYIAVACVDGSVHVKPIDDLLSSAVLKCTFQDTALRVSLLSDHSVASGGESGRVVITRLGWLSTLRSKEIFSGGLGAISGLCANPSRSEVVAWTDDMGLCVYGNSAVKRLALASLDEDGPVVQLSWYDLDSIAIATQTRVCLVDFRAMRVMYSFSLAEPLLGLVPFGGRDGRMVLVYAKKVVLFESKAGVQLAECSLASEARLVAFEARWMSQTGSTLHLETGLPLIFVLLTDGKLVFLRRSGIDDSLHDAVASKDFSRAFKIAKGDGTLMPPATLSMTAADVAEAWLTHLITHGRAEEAAALLPEVLDAKDLSAWSRWAAVLLERRALGPVVAELPAPGLPPIFYETALLQLKQDGDYDQIVSLLRRWPAECVDARKVYDALRAGAADRLEGAGEVVVSLSGSTNNKLQRALAVCLARLGEPPESVFTAFVDAKALDALDMLDVSPWLWAHVLENSRVVDVVGLDETRAMASLFEYLRDRDDLPRRVLDVCADLVKSKLPAAALKLLRRVGGARRSDYVRGSAFEALCDLEIELCAQVDPNRLFELLRDSKAFSPELALGVCRRTPGRLRETVYVLGRMGGPDNSLAALTILIKELDDLDAALEFAAREGDWETLIGLCQTDVEKLGDLLERGPRWGLEPSRLLRAVPLGMQVPRLKARIQQLFVDVKAAEKACDCCSRIFRADTSSVVQRGHRMLRRALKVRIGVGACALCASTPLSEGDLVLFHDGSVYHRSCLEAQARLLVGTGDFARQTTTTMQNDWAVMGTGSLVRGHCVAFARGSKLL